MKLEKWALAAALFAIACDDKAGDTGDGGAGGDDTGSGGGDEIDCATDAWADQASDTKAAWMGACVVPTMSTLFQDFDSDAFSGFSCSTCHGDGNNGGTFEMPNTRAIDLAEWDQWPEGYSDFMNQQVAPTMAGILGYDVYDPKTGDGFGCAGCHVIESR